MQTTMVEQMDLQEQTLGSTQSMCQSGESELASQMMIGKMIGRVREEHPVRWKCCMNTRVFNALRPLMRTCGAAGLLFRVDFSRNGIKKYFTLSHFYSVLVMIFLTTNSLRFLMIFGNNETLYTSFLLKLLSTIFNAECLAHFVCFYIASCSYKRLPEFFIQWENVQAQFSVSLTSIKRQAYICTAILWIFVIINTGSFAYLVWGTQKNYSVVLPLSSDHPHINIMKVVNLVVGTFQTVAWLLSGVPDYFDRNKILSGYDLSHYQVPHCIKSFLLFCLICVYSSQFSILFWIMYLLWHFGYLPIIKFEFC